ncbi:MAG: hydantoinase/oxoprolinase family protein [Eggerthellaceae bacterium]|nr:hydantoinase/oxoprolinase family protein [Eggerthellaceae bacterium]
MIGIGIDTGGTYTDAVAYDMDKKEVIAKGKARTTKEDLSIGICAALDSLPVELLGEARQVVLSTTLATNACVEGKGGRARLVLVGTNESVLHRIDAPVRYGFSYDDVRCIDVTGEFDGSSVVQPDWDAFIEENEDWLKEAQAFGIVEMNAARNGAVVERAGKKALAGKYHVPIIMASELVNKLNMMERGATAILNARLLPTIEDFLDSVERALRDRGVNASVSIVRSDGSLMGEEQTRQTPVETMVSGPAASVQGCCHLVGCDTALIVDMGGTTTDISLIEQGTPIKTKGIRIGNWRTQIPGVYIDTFGLGGDSAVKIGSDELFLSERRVEPICMAASRWPELCESFKKLLDDGGMWVRRELYEVLYLARDPQCLDNYSKNEKRLIEVLRDGPMVIGDQKYFEPYDLGVGRIAERLETEGIVMRCGLTPTDIMHIRGDFDAFDTHASELAATYVCKVVERYSTWQRSADGKTDQKVFHLSALCDDVYDLVKRKLFLNVVRILLEQQFPRAFANGVPTEVLKAFDTQWDYVKKSGRVPFNTKKPLIGLDFLATAPLIGVGAPTHIFLPDVAAALGTECIIPEHAEVANAIGAISARIIAQSSVIVAADWGPNGIKGYAVLLGDKRVYIKDRDAAENLACQHAKKDAEQKARQRGATGEIEITITWDEENSSASGVALLFKSIVTATARPK